MVRIRVHVSSQTLVVSDGPQPVRRYKVSTSRYGTGTAPGSFKTPLGRFRVVQKLGAGAAPGEILNGERAGEMTTGDDGEVVMVTRVLSLDGMGRRNANTFARNIHIHGTPALAELGSPAGHGCVRMDSVDIIDLFDLVEVGTKVRITRR